MENDLIKRSEIPAFLQNNIELKPTSAIDITRSDDLSMATEEAFKSKEREPQSKTKNCPFCAEEILAEAIKCRYCHERLNGSGSPAFEDAGVIGLQTSAEKSQQQGVIGKPRFHPALLGAVAAGTTLLGVVIYEGLLRFEKQSTLSQYRQSATTPTQSPEHKQSAGQPDSQRILAKRTQNDAEQIFRLAQRYEAGEGVPQNSLKAFELYRQAAAQHHAQAQLYLGVYYQLGEVIPQNYSEALKLYKEAAAQGVPEALSRAGQIYLEGMGVAQDYAKALFWFENGAEKGDVLSQIRLGQMYEIGDGVPKDRITALMWFTLATAKGWEDPLAGMAFRNLDELKSLCTKRQIEEGLRRARDWQRAHGRELSN